MFALAFILATLAPLPSPHQSFDAGIARVERFGNAHGKPLVLIPGLACGPWVWGNQIQALGSRYDIYTLTLPGFDGRPMIGGDLMHEATLAVHTLIASRHLKNPIVVGHSLGGTITVMFAEQYPNDAAKIVSAEGGFPEGATQAARDAAVAQTIKPYQTATQATIGSALHDNLLQYTITAPADIAAATTLASVSKPEAVVKWMQAALSLDLTPQLNVIRVPFTEIIPFDPQIDPYQGFKTKEQKLEAYQQWIAHAPHGTIQVITPSRHFVMIDQPKAFEEALEAAIE